MEIRDYIAARIRRSVPPDSYVIPGSTPVIAFGNVPTARVATLGLNPSKREFTTTKGEWLAGDDRRLSTYDSLGIKDLTAADDAAVVSVVQDCYEYFQRKPYMTWFGALESVLQSAARASYFDGTACHLDLVQWATEPVWQKLPPPIRAHLIADDREFLIQQLERESISTVLLNGKAVIEQAVIMGVHFDQILPFASGRKQCQIFIGDKFGAKFIGWSVNLQSSFGVSNDFKIALAGKIRQLLG